jgi:bifunctional UDP-N-acetylglucosamine pyrophosphorylase/glucosamine-1-phosphate N-acetyltransferase
MSSTETTASIIMAAGRGSRMKGYDGNKTLLPLVPGESAYSGRQPILVNLFANLPEGPRAIVVNHCKGDVMKATDGLDAVFCDQPILNGTGGAIIAARSFINAQSCQNFVITMGDVPFVKKETYARMVSLLTENDIVILGFCPDNKKQYGVLEIDDGRVTKITEWKYWKDYPAERQQSLSVCNSGIYAITKEALDAYLPVLESRPQIVSKEVNGKMTDIKEFFITDLIEYMVADGRSVGYLVAETELETMGIDDPEALKKAQAAFSPKGRFR